MKPLSVVIQKMSYLFLYISTKIIKILLFPKILNFSSVN